MRPGANAYHFPPAVGPYVDRVQWPYMHITSSGRCQHLTVNTTSTEAASIIQAVPVRNLEEELAAGLFHCDVPLVCWL